MPKNIRSVLYRLFIIVVIAIFVAVPFNSAFFAEGTGNEAGVSSETALLNEGEAGTSPEEVVLPPSLDDGETPVVPEGTEVPLPEEESSTGSEEQPTVAYDPQPATLEEVQLAVDEFNAAFAEYLQNGGDMPQKPHWEFEVEAELMPKGYFTELVREDVGFEADYYTFFAGVAATAGEWGGSGTALIPYVISDAAGLQKLAQNVNSGATYSGTYFLLANDIDLNSQAWTPIGTAANNQELFHNHTNTYLFLSLDKAFKGTFDGGGNTVRNFSVGSASVSTGFAADFKGFFGLLDGATVRNLNLQNATVRGGSGIGVLAGYITGSVTIEDCNVIDSSVTAGGGQNFASGGLVGVMNLETGNVVNITNTKVSNTVLASTADYGRVGGLIGNIRSHHSTNSPFINANVNIDKSSVNGGSVTSQYYYVGGLVGEIDFYNSGGTNVTVRNTQTNTPVKTTSASGYYVGGFIGFTHIQVTSPQNTILIEDSSAAGDVNAAGYYVGGFIGYSEHTSGAATIAQPMKTIVRNSYATGNVTSTFTEGSNVGGFIGHAHAGDNLPAGTMLVENCYSTGNVWGGGYNVGGFMARPSKNILIRNSYSTGDVFGQRNHIGGFIAYAEGNEISGNVLIENCFSTGNVVGLGYYVGGFIGWLQASQVTNSYSVGSVYSTNHSTGGFIGKVEYISKVTNCYSAGHVSSTSSSGIGGFIGNTAAQRITITNSYFDSTTSQKTAGIGQMGGQTVAQVSSFSTRGMVSISSYDASWKVRENRFGAASGSGSNATPWYIDNDITYPYLYFQFDGKSDKDSNYNLGAVLYSADSGQSYKPLGQFSTDFRFETSLNLRFKIRTTGAEKVFFPFAHGTTSSNYNMFQYKFSVPEIVVPASGNFSFAANTPYSLGSISRTGIVAFSSSPYAEKTSDRPVYAAGNETTYTYVGDRITYSVFIANYSREFDWRNIVFTDTLANGVKLVPESVQVDGVQLGTSGVPSYIYDESSNTLSVMLPNMPKDTTGNPASTTVTFMVDVGSGAASEFPLVASADNIRNKGDVTGILHLEGVAVQQFTAPIDDKNTDPVFPKYNVIYNGNGGLSPIGETQVSGGYFLPETEYTVEEKTFNRQGYYLTGWNSAQDASGILYAVGDKFQLNANTTLYAVWQKNPTLTFTKVDGVKAEGGEYEGLAGAKFSLYLWEGTPQANYPELENEPNWALVGSVTSDENGQVVFDGLALSSTYLLVESTAPNGYELPNAQWLIHVEDNAKITFGKMLSGKPAFAVQTVADKNYIPNYTLSQAYELPDAGGVGVAQLLATGLILMALSALGLFARNTFASGKKGETKKAHHPKSKRTAQ